MGSTRQHAESLAHNLKGLQSSVDVGVFVGSRNLDSNSGLANGHDRIRETNDVDPFPKHRFSKGAGEASIVEHDGNDGVNSWLDGEAEGRHALAEARGGTLQAIPKNRRFSEEIQAREGSRD
jgi:hypothetical protein